MKTKKSPGANLENKKTLFFEIGMIVALAIVFAAFQWSVEHKSSIILKDGKNEIFTDVMMPITRPEPPKPPELPKPVIKKDIVIVDNKSNIKETTCIFPTEVDPNQGLVQIEIPDEKPIQEPEYVYRAEKMPEFPGGLAALIKYISKHIQYPYEAAINNVQGKVFIEFRVNKLGEIEHARIVKGVDPLLDAEALRVVKNLPRWTPGMQNEKPVTVCFTIPVNFTLSNL